MVICSAAAGCTEEVPSNRAEFSMAYGDAKEAFTRLSLCPREAALVDRKALSGLRRRFEVVRARASRLRINRSDTDTYFDKIRTPEELAPPGCKAVGMKPGYLDYRIRTMEQSLAAMENGAE
jgi:hypothetical protein